MLTPPLQQLKTRHLLFGLLITFLGLVLIGFAFPSDAQTVPAPEPTQIEPNTASNEPAAAAGLQTETGSVPALSPPDVDHLDSPKSQANGPKPIKDLWQTVKFRIGLPEESPSLNQASSESKQPR